MRNYLMIWRPVRCGDRALEIFQFHFFNDDGELSILWKEDDITSNFWKEVDVCA